MASYARFETTCKSFRLFSLQDVENWKKLCIAHIVDARRSPYLCPATVRIVLPRPSPLPLSVAPGFYTQSIERFVRDLDDKIVFNYKSILEYHVNEFAVNSVSSECTSALDSPGLPRSFRFRSSGFHPTGIITDARKWKSYAALVTLLCISLTTSVFTAKGRCRLCEVLLDKSQKNFKPFVSLLSKYHELPIRSRAILRERFRYLPAAIRDFVPFLQQDENAMKKSALLVDALRGYGSISFAAAHLLPSWQVHGALAVNPYTNYAFELRSFSFSRQAWVRMVGVNDELHLPENLSEFQAGLHLR